MTFYSIKMSNLYVSPLVTQDSENGEDLEDFYLKDKNLIDERSAVAPNSEKEVEVVSSTIEVSGSFFVNRSALEDQKEDLAKKSEEDLGE